MHSNGINTATVNTQQPVGSASPILPWLTALYRCGSLTETQAHQLGQRFQSQQLQQHPLHWLATLALQDNRQTGAVLTAEAILALVAGYCRIEIASVSRLGLDMEMIASVIPSGFARHHGLLTLSCDSKRVVVACSDPFNCDKWIDELSAALNRTVVPVLADPDIIRRYGDECYSLHRSMSDFGTQLPDPPLPTLDFSGNSDQIHHTETICDWIIHSAADERASDIHIEPHSDRSLLRLRIDGLLRTLYQIPLTVSQAVCNRFKILAGMDVAERRRPQDGHFQYLSNGITGLELRVATMPVCGGEKMVIRLLNQQLQLNLADLGMDRAALVSWQQATIGGRGLALVTGPTGSGKSTTLYATLRTLARGELNICTVEDPIEIVQSGFNQTQVRPDLGLDFAASIRALMRQDPDIIMIGEIRDRETARMAIQAALTGHQVFASLHTGDSLSTIVRLLELGIPAYLLRATLTAVIAQRLLRRQCTDCWQPQPVAIAKWQRLSPLPAPELLQQSTGCSKCRHTGIRGQTGVFEVLHIDSILREKIDTDITATQMRKLAIENGLNTLSHACTELVRAGTVSLDEAVTVCDLIQ